MSTLALDLGSTRIKAARIDAEGRVLEFEHCEAPAITASGLRREFDAMLLIRRAVEALGRVRGRVDLAEALAVASQRSTFVLFDSSSAGEARALTPAISWQDRRAVDWIAPRAAEEGWIGELTGLPLSAHYIGPKLAAMFAQDRELARRAAVGELRLGTLETWLNWSLAQNSRREDAHVSDESMAARSLLYDPKLGTWSPRLCEFFGVPPSLLPRVQPSFARSDDLGGSKFAASIADQSAGALHAVGASSDGVLVNFGTGTFVLAPIGSTWMRRPGYLTTLLMSRGANHGARERTYAIEGTINAGAGLILQGDSPASYATDDLPVEACALVDENGIGAPHWRADLGPIWSPTAQALEPSARRRVAELGLCFRVRELLEDLGTKERRCVVAGGALHDVAFAQRLADALGRTIEVCLEPEATLLGVAGLARGDDFARGRAQTRAVLPSRSREQLDERFRAWRRWSASALRR